VVGFTKNGNEVGSAKVRKLQRENNRKKTIETITEFLMVLMVIKGNVLVLMETEMVLVGLSW